VQTKLRQTVSVKDFGAVGDGVTDDTAAIKAARDYAASSGAAIVFPQGDYKYSVSPNWGVSNLQVIAQGRVRLYYTGTGNALIFDAGTTAGDLVYNVNFGNDNKFHVFATSSALNGVYVRSVHHSYIGVDVHGCGTSSAGLLVEFAVCTTFNVVVSGNEGGWYLSAKPYNGYLLDKRLAGETTSYCQFPNPIVEGVTIGINLKNTLGNNFIGGTSEGCSAYGVYADTNALNDKFFGTDFEVNTIADIYCMGDMTEFYGVDTYTIVSFGTTAKRTRLIGGSHESILVDTGATGCSVRDVIYNRRVTGGTFSDFGTGTEISNVRNGVTPYTQFLTGSVTISSASVAYPGTAVETITVSGAKFGDKFTVAGSVSLASFDVTAQVISANTVAVHLTNITGASATKPACTLTVSGIRGS
jgi:hypothetical protein